ncbi:T9SS type A sorting domain-containing protein [Hymenobacter sp. NST-14]|uniref:T9SS type A sorting domain-containing protein n=1 Tax=Hymenobacter piscis TaxID=2839984 RepID=UPI001C014A96|nr:T9SS type A sorting domain-containing protein [Hymenobacter piscis]MBT9395581.1 T9SS type A sorting domain-containing protein [Hymenobacter piscis]
MKALSTLSLAAALAATTLGAQAQITVDGTLAPAEVGVGTGHYQLVGTYTGAHSVADRGLKALYLGTTATTLHVMVVGSPEQTAYSALVLYLDAPGKTGIAAGTQLPGSSNTSSQLRHKPTLDMPVDYGFRITVSPLKDGNNAMYLSRVDYTITPPATGGYPEIGMGSAAKDGSVAVDSNDPAAAQTAFQTSATGSVAANTSTGWEFSIPLSALGGSTNGGIFNVMAGYVADNGDFYSDVLPAVAGQTADLGVNPDFTALAGKQFYSYQVGSGVLAARSAAGALALRTFPNPLTADSRLSYRVSTGQGPVSVTAYNSLGQVACTLLDNATRPAGEHTLALTPLQALPAGIYLLQVRAGDQLSTQRVVVR